MGHTQSQRELSAWKAAEAYGCDMQQLEANLARTPRERIRRHARCLETAVMLRKAMSERHARS